MEIKLVDRRTSCRGCSKKLKIGQEPVFRTYSSAARGTTVILCRECCEKVKELWEEYDAGSDDK